MIPDQENPTTPEANDYQEWRDQFLSDPAKTAMYEEEAAKGELWLQLVEARQSAGLTQEEMARRLGASQGAGLSPGKRGL